MDSNDQNKVKKWDKFEDEEYNLLLTDNERWVIFNKGKVTNCLIVDNIECGCMIIWVSE